jgi:hypothetical protein
MEGYSRSYRFRYLTIILNHAHDYSTRLDASRRRQSFGASTVRACMLSSRRQPNIAGRKSMPSGLKRQERTC